MKKIIFFLVFSNPLFSQLDSTFREKKEVFCGINYGGNLGFNAGYDNRIREKKRLYYRLDVQYAKRYYTNTNSDNFDYFWYKNLTINSVIVNNMLSLRFYQKRHDRLYFETGAYFGINLWQVKNGQTYNYNSNQTQGFNKTYYFLPNELGLHLGGGIRPTKHLLLKPEIRFGILTFDKLFEDDGFLDEMRRNARLSLSFNIAYLF